MFQSLTDKLTSALKGITGRGALTETHVNDALREIRVALLEADVALPVVKDFIEAVRAKAVGQAVIKSVSPAQQVVKIVHDEIVSLLGAELCELNLNTQPPAVILMTGLQGSGKTTTSAKLGKYFSSKLNKKVVMASLDVHRPAAQDQLRILGEQVKVDTLPIISGQSPLQITKRALEAAKLAGADILILDTAGRLAIDQALMAELASIRDTSNPIETLLVTDAMTGQDAVNTAKAFATQIGITGIILTRVDGDARGGAALSMRAVTGKPIKFLGVGEKTDALEPFHPDRLAGRILGMGDVVSLVEKAVENINQEDAAKMAAKFQKGEFDLNDLLAQLRQMKNMGGISSIAKMLPGLSQYTDQIEKANLDDKVTKRQEAMILSMTPLERARPLILNASRKRRIAEGSGTTVQDLNRLIKQYQQMHTMMKRVKKMGMGKMMGMMKGLMGGKDADMMDQLQGMAPDGMDMAQALEALQKTPGGIPKLPGLGGTPFDGFSSKFKK